MTSQVRVYLRERPSQEQPAFTKSVANDETTIILDSMTMGPAQHQIVLDGVFEQSATQEDIFQQVGKQAIDELMNQISQTIICYGATSTGKSYTAFGEDECPGLAFECLNNLFEQIQARQLLQTAQIYISLTEIYIDKVYDLFTNKRVEIRQDNNGFYCEGLQELEIDSASQAVQFLHEALLNRRTAENYANMKSSRSHVLFNIGIIETDRTSTLESQSILTICDLAGSEILKKINTFNNQSNNTATSVRLQETQYINKSLSALSNVIMQLANKEKFVNYRDSKLTMLLQKSLGGNSQTSVICCVFNDEEEETCHTIEFANRCRNIVNSISVEYTDIGKIEENLLIQKLQEENLELKEKNDELQNENNQLKEKQNLDYTTTLYEKRNSSGAEEQNETYDAQPEPAGSQIGSQAMQSSEEKLSNYLEQHALLARSSKESIGLESETERGQNTAILAAELVPKDSVSTMRKKLVEKNEEIQRLMSEKQRIQAEDRRSIQLLKDEVASLQEEIKQQNELMERQIADLQSQKYEALQLIGTKSENLCEESEKRLAQTLSLIPSNQQQGLEEFEVAEILESQRVELATLLDVSNMEYVQQLKDDYNRRIRENQINSEQVIMNLRNKLESLQAAQQEENQAILWLYSEVKKCSSAIADAAEGKLLCTVMNESEVVQFVANYQAEVCQYIRNERFKLHAAVDFIDVASLQKELPISVNEAVLLAQADKRPQSGISCSSILSLSSRPQTAESERSITQINQPHLKTGYQKQKAPNVSLNMNVHISPRPQSAMSCSSSLNARGSGVIGSCGGTQDLSQKMYQKYGW